MRGERSSLLGMKDKRKTQEPLALLDVLSPNQLRWVLPVKSPPFDPPTLQAQQVKRDFGQASKSQAAFLSPFLGLGFLLLE